MSTFSFFRFFLLVLVFSVALNNQNMPQAYAQKRRMEILYPSGCTLSDCGEKCRNKRYEQYNGHSCIPTVPLIDEAYYCTFFC